MSAGSPEDIANTIAQIQCPKLPVKGRNWLRHRIDSQAALIDDMLLGTGHTLNEIANALHEKFQDEHPKRQHGEWITRIRSHLSHLTNGDPTYQEPHRLNIVEADGRFRFDYAVQPGTTRN